MVRKFVGCSIWVLLALVACGKTTGSSDGKTGSSNGKASGSRLQFAWPAPARARVVATIIDDGEKSVVKYDVVTERVQNGEVHVRIENLDLVEIEGVDLNDPAQRAELEPVRAMAAVIPTMRVGANGQIVGFIGMDEMIEATLLNVKKIEGWTDTDPKWLSATKRLRSPAGKDLVRGKSEEFWRIWVGLWAGIDLAPGTTRQLATRLPMSDGSTESAPITLQNHGPVAGDPSLVRLTAATVFEGDGARDAMVRVMAAKMTEAGSAAFDPSLLKSVKRQITIDTTTSPATLMPKTVREEKTVFVEMLNSAEVAERREIVTTGAEGDHFHQDHRGPGDHLSRSGPAVSATG